MRDSHGVCPRGCLREIGLVLAAEPEAFDDLLVFLLTAGLDVVKKLAAARDELEQAAAGREVLGVDIEMIRQIVNPLGEKGHLIRGAAGVSFVELIILRVDRGVWCCGTHDGRGWAQRVLAKPS